MPRNGINTLRQTKLRKSITDYETRWPVQGISNKINEVMSKLLTKNGALNETKNKIEGSEKLGQYDTQRGKKRVSILISKMLKSFITSWKPIAEGIIKMNITSTRYII